MLEKTLSNENASLETVQSTTQAQINIYKLNKFEWWAAQSLQDALDGAATHWSIPVEEILDELEPPFQLQELTLWQNHLIVNGNAVPFKLQLQSLIENGVAFPQLFGTTL
jgi:hypothetical protein